MAGIAFVSRVQLGEPWHCLGRICSYGSWRLTLSSTWVKGFWNRSCFVWGVFNKHVKGLLFREAFGAQLSLYTAEMPPSISKVVTKTHFLIVTPAAVVALLPVLCFCWQNFLTSPKSLIFASMLHGLGTWNPQRVRNEHFGRAVLAYQLCRKHSCLSLQLLQKSVGTNFNWITVSQQTGPRRSHKEGRRGSPAWIPLFSCQRTAEKL